MNPNDAIAIDRPSGEHLWRRILPPVFLTAAVVAAYSNSFYGALLFDDVYHIVENERIRRLWPPWELLGVERPVVELSLAANYALGGLNPWGYHAFNLVVHVLATLTLFGVLRRTLLAVATKPRSHEATHSYTVLAAGSLLAFAIALLWGVHPLQTQSVTYIIQRGESLMGLFYLLTLYCAIRGLRSPRPIAWYAGAIVACGLGMASKAIMVTAPLMVCLYDFVFLRSRREDAPLEAAVLDPGPDRSYPSKGRWVLYAGLAATWGVLWACGVTGEVFSSEARRAGVGFGFQGFGSLEYALTQPGVILNYLKLAFWPLSLCLDYDWPIASDLEDFLLPLLILGGLLFFSLRELARRTWLGFAGAWFFIILAPTSSFIPVKDPAFEHRMYLPLAAVVAVMVLGGSILLSRLPARGSWGAKITQVLFATAVLAAAVLLGKLTYQRNKDYQSDRTMWADVVNKRPGNARAHVALGNSLAMRNEVEEAIASYRRALAIRNDLPESHVNLGTALSQKGMLDEAISSFRESVRLDPDLAKAHYNLGNALGRQGKVDEAIQSYRECLRIQPRYAEAHCNLGNAISRLGDFEEAMKEYREALRLNPQMANCHNNLGHVLRQLGRIDEAVAEFLEAIRLQPNYANAYVNLAAAHFDRGQLEDAAKHAQEALRIEPGHAAAREIMTEVEAALSGRARP